MNNFERKLQVLTFVCDKDIKIKDKTIKKGVNKMILSSENEYDVISFSNDNKQKISGHDAVILVKKLFSNILVSES